MACLTTHSTVWFPVSHWVCLHAVFEITLFNLPRSAVSHARHQCLLAVPHCVRAFFLFANAMSACASRLLVVAHACYQSRSISRRGPGKSTPCRVCTATPGQSCTRGSPCARGSACCCHGIPGGATRTHHPARCRSGEWKPDTCALELRIPCQSSDIWRLCGKRCQPPSQVCASPCQPRSPAKVL